MTVTPGTISPARSYVALIVFTFLLANCRPMVPDRPSIEVTTVPVASAGGPLEMQTIAGHVKGARPGQQVVLYARGGIWWVQPMTDQPFTKVQPDLSWKNSTHLGTEYAVLLVDPGYHPASKLLELPEVGNGIQALKVVAGTSSPPSSATPLRFSGFDWTIRSTNSDRGGNVNVFDPANVWTDQKGFLHLRMEERNGRWSCGEVSLAQSLGYGTYRFFLSDTSHLPPSAVLDIFTWDDSRSQGLVNELDIELSRWGDAQAKNAQYAIQPFYLPENMMRFDAPAGPLLHEFTWRPDKVTFQTVRRGATSHQLVEEHVFASGIPKPATEKLRMDLYDFHHAASGLRQPVEVVFERFEYVR